jgi:3-methyladenine DNA glycosylase/8-oxoguanine DNA glycosylase
VTNCARLISAICPGEQQFVQIAERWRPYRSRAVMYLFASEFEAQSTRS